MEEPSTRAHSSLLVDHCGTVIWEASHGEGLFVVDSFGLLGALGNLLAHLKGSCEFPGAIVDVRAIGYMVMEDEKGLDEKVLAVPTSDPRFSEYRTLRDVPEHLLREIAHFFETYKALEKKKWAKVGGWKGTEDTLELIEKTHAAYMAEQKAKADEGAR